MSPQSYSIYSSPRRLAVRHADVRENVALARFLEVELAFDAAPRLVGDAVGLVGLRNRAAFDVEQPELDLPGLADGIIARRGVGRHRELRLAIRVALAKRLDGGRQDLAARIWRQCIEHGLDAFETRRPFRALV